VSTTPLSLLERLRRGPTQTDWDRLYSVYRPLIRSWLDRVPGLRDEADDVAQEVMVVLVRELPQFERQREGSFRAWLRQVTANRVREFWRKRARQLQSPESESFLSRLEDPASELAGQWDREHDRHVFHRLEEIIRPDFEESTWQAYRRFAVEGKPADEVAAELGLTRNAVILAKSRVLRRLREETGILIE
jgi:RNA polymerase sigma-70 factor (ECF subfamily)